MKKKLIIMIVAAGLISFGGSLFFAWLTRPSPQSLPVEPNQPALADTETELEPSQPQIGMLPGTGASDSKPTSTVMEKKLKSLVYEVQVKMQEYNDKLQGLQVREQRLQLAQETLKKDIENLNNLRVELTSIVAGLKNERNKLVKSRIEVEKAEKANLIKIAAAYDRMDSASAGKILTNMCTSQLSSAAATSSGGTMGDAVKILHYMSERTKANLLAEMVNSQPELAAMLCRKLKQIAEQN